MICSVDSCQLRSAHVLPVVILQERDSTGVFAWTVFPALDAGNNWVSEVFADPEDKIGTNLAEAGAFTVPSARLTHPPRILVLYGCWTAYESCDSGD